MFGNFNLGILVTIGLVIGIYFSADEITTIFFEI